MNNVIEYRQMSFMSFSRLNYEGVYNIDTNDGTVRLEVEDASPTSSVEDIYEKINKMIIEPESKVLNFKPSMFSIPKFIAEFDAERIDENDVVKMLDLNGSIPATNMVLFNGNGQIRKYNEISEIIAEWYDIRYNCYDKRIKYIIGVIEKELITISNKYRFVKEIALDKTLDVNNKKKAVLEKELEDKKYDKIDESYSYLLSMPIHSLTMEKLEELKKEEENTKNRLEYYRNITVEELWENELKKLLEALEKEYGK